MGDMFFQDQKQREQAQLKLQMDSQQFIQNAPISMDAEMLSGQYTYFEKTESVLTKSIPKDANIDQAAVMSPQERSKKSKDEKELDKKALAVSEKELQFKRSLTTGQLPEAADSKQLMELKIDAIKQGLIVSEQKIKQHYEPLIGQEKDKEEKKKLEKEYDLALKKARFESARDIGKAASYYVETLKAAETSEEDMITACAYKEDLLVEADALERTYRASSIVNEKEREREEHTVKKHYWYDVLKGIFRKKNPFSHEGAVIERDGHRYVNVGRAFYGGTKAMYIFEDRSEGAGVEDENGIIHYPQFLYKEATNCIGMDKPEGALATEAAAKIQKLISGDYAIDAFAVRDKDGKVCGSLQRKVEKYDAKTGGTPDVNLYSWQEAPETSISNGQGEDMDKQIKSEVLREHTLDWILCNFDTKGENFIYRTDKHLSSFDKEASFSFLKDPGSATMSLDYVPHTHNTIYNVLFTSFVEGKQDLDFAVIEENIRKVEAAVEVNGGADYMANFKDMLDQKYGEESPKNTKRKEAYDLILKRATDIRETYRVFLGQLVEQRDKYSKEHNLAIDNSYMQRFGKSEWKDKPSSEFLFTDEINAMKDFKELVNDHSADIHLEQLSYTPESLAELKKATNAVVEKCNSVDVKILGVKYELRVAEILSKMVKQKKRLDAYSQEDIESGVWLDKEKGMYFSSPKEVMLKVEELPDMQSDLFETLYQAQLEKFKNDPKYTRNRHYVRACEFQLKRFVAMTGAISTEVGQASKKGVVSNVRFIPKYKAMLGRFKNGTTVPSDIPHLEKLKAAFVFLEKMMNDMKEFEGSESVIADFSDKEKHMDLAGDIRYFYTDIITAVEPIWNLLAGELQGNGLMKITKHNEGWGDMIRSGAMSACIDGYLQMAQKKELAHNPDLQKIAYSSQRVEADKLSEKRKGTDQPMSKEEADLRLKDLEVEESVSQARIIASDMEMETQRRLDELKLRKEDQIEAGKELSIPIHSLIDDYTNTSLEFRKHLLLKETEKKKKVPHSDQYKGMERRVGYTDEALKRLAALRSESSSQPMTTYRYASYKDEHKNEHNPFGEKIEEGDIVMDVSYCSTSAGKQFIGRKETNSRKVTSYVRMSITGTSGVPIARPGGVYSNERKAKLNEAGQSEVLYPRNTCFRVVRIKTEGTGDDKVSGVVLEEVKKEDLPKGQIIKDMYTGDPISE